MKKLGILFIMMLAITVTSMAQGFGGGMQMDPEERAKRTVEQIKEAVGLNADQEKKVLELTMKQNEKMSEKMQEMRDSGDGFEGMREIMTANTEETSKKMKEILTADQYKKYEAYLEERASRRGGGFGGGPQN